MYVGALLTLAGFTITFFATEMNWVKADIRKESPNISASELNEELAIFIAIYAVFGLAVAALWIWMARKNLAGRNWARILATVFFGINTVLSLGLLIPADDFPVNGPEIATAVLCWLVSLAAMILLWRPSSARHFRPDARTEPEPGVASS